MFSLSVVTKSFLGFLLLSQQLLWMLLSLKSLLHVVGIIVLALCMMFLENCKGELKLKSRTKKSVVFGCLVLSSRQKFDMSFEKRIGQKNTKQTKYVII